MAKFNFQNQFQMANFYNFKQHKWQQNLNRQINFKKINSILQKMAKFKPINFQNMAQFILNKFKQNGIIFNFINGNINQFLIFRGNLFQQIFKNLDKWHRGNNFLQKKLVKRRINVDLFFHHFCIRINHLEVFKFQFFNNSTSPLAHHQQSRKKNNNGQSQSKLVSHYSRAQFFAVYQAMKEYLQIKYYT
ncbi:hypothetical protein ABPG74_015280 [Tetrahymena malaccensis]